MAKDVTKLQVLRREAYPGCEWALNAITDAIANVLVSERQRETRYTQRRGGGHVTTGAENGVMRPQAEECQ